MHQLICTFYVQIFRIMSDVVPTMTGGKMRPLVASAGSGWCGSGPGGEWAQPPDVNELGQWSDQWRPPEPALVAATRARTMRRRRRIRAAWQPEAAGLLHHFPPHSSTSWCCFPCARVSAPARLSIARRGCCWFKPPQSVLGRGEAHMPWLL